MFEDIDADVYVMADGDDTYPADAAPAMVDKVLEGYDMVIGDRLSSTYFQENKNDHSTTSVTVWYVVPSMACSMRTSPTS